MPCQNVGASGSRPLDMTATSVLYQLLYALPLVALCAGDWALAHNADSDRPRAPELNARSLYDHREQHQHRASRFLQQTQTTRSAAEELTWPLDFTDLDRAAETQRILRSVVAER